MDYTSIFTLMRAEVTLTAILVFVFLYDLMAGERARRRFSAVVCCLMVVQVVVNLVPAAGGELFGGMFCHTPMDGIVKSMLSVGALIVFLQSDTWLRREDTRHKQGEFYILTLSTLLGMYFMIGAGNFLLFFIGLELASVPMACLVAFDKYKRYSAEAGAKYILCALFSSGLMLYGISFLYGTTGTLYFGDMAARIDGSPLQVMALVFFLPLSCLASFTDIKKLQEGDTISVLNGITICEKYVPAVKRASGSGGVAIMFVSVLILSPRSSKNTLTRSSWPTTSPHSMLGIW